MLGSDHREHFSCYLEIAYTSAETSFRSALLKLKATVHNGLDWKKHFIKHQNNHSKIHGPKEQIEHFPQKEHNPPSLHHNHLAMMAHRKHHYFDCWFYKMATTGEYKTRVCYKNEDQLLMQGCFTDEWTSRVYCLVVWPDICL